jgi:hypothetical protein
MIKQKLMMMLGVAAMALTACNNQAEIGEIAEKETTPVEIEFTGTIADNAKTRVSDTSWDKGDSIGVFIDTVAVNNKYVTTDGDGVFTTENFKLLKGSDTHKVYAYYPYSSSYEADTTVINSMSANPEDQKKYDYMVAEATVSSDSPKVKLEFKRKMMRLVINVRTSAADGFNADDVFGNVKGSSIKSSFGELSYLINKTHVNFPEGLVEATGSNVSGLELKNGVQDTTNHVLRYTIILPPQKDGIYYLHVFNGYRHGIVLSTTNKKFEAGYSYTYNVTYKRTGLTVTDSTIEAWNDQDQKDFEIYYTKD